jgi:hypothetical protein
MLSFESPITDMPGDWCHEETNDPGFATDAYRNERISAQSLCPRLVPEAIYVGGAASVLSP